MLGVMHEKMIYMKKKGEEMMQNYSELSKSINQLIEFTTGVKRTIDNDIAFTTKHLQNKNLPTTGMKYVEAHLTAGGYNAHGQQQVLAINDVTSSVNGSHSSSSSASASGTSASNAFVDGNSQPHMPFPLSGNGQWAVAGSMGFTNSEWGTNNHSTNNLDIYDVEAEGVDGEGRPTFSPSPGLAGAIGANGLQYTTTSKSNPSTTPVNPTPSPPIEVFDTSGASRVNTQNG